MLSVQQFINKNNYNIKYDETFKSIFYPLYDNQKILINMYILDLFINDVNISQYKRNLNDSQQNPIDVADINKNIYYKRSIFKINLDLYKINYSIYSFKDIFNKLTYYKKFIIYDLIDINYMHIKNFYWIVLSKENFKLLIEIFNVSCKKLIIKKEINDIKMIIEYYNIIEIIEIEYKKYINNSEIILNNNISNNILELCTFNEKVEILISENILNFIIKKINLDLNNKFYSFINFLIKNNINFEEINYKSKKCIHYESIRNYINNECDIKKLYLKKWILISISDFTNIITNKKF